MVSRLECTRVHFVQVSVSRPDGQGLGLGLKTWKPRSRSWSQDSMLGAYACSTITVMCSTFKRMLCQLELMQPVMWSQDSNALEFILSSSRSQSRGLKKVLTTALNDTITTKSVMLITLNIPTLIKSHIYRPIYKTWTVTMQTKKTMIAVLLSSIHHRIFDTQPCSVKE